MSMTPRNIVHNNTKDSNQLEIKNYAKKSTKVTSFVQMDSVVKGSDLSKNIKNKTENLQYDIESQSGED